MPQPPVAAPSQLEDPQAPPGTECKDSDPESPQLPIIFQIIHTMCGMSGIPFIKREQPISACFASCPSPSCFQAGSWIENREQHTNNTKLLGDQWIREGAKTYVRVHVLSSIVHGCLQRHERNENHVSHESAMYQGNS